MTGLRGRLVAFESRERGINAFKNLGINVVKANVFLDSSGKHNKFTITITNAYSEWLRAISLRARTANCLLLIPKKLQAKYLAEVVGDGSTLQGFVHSIQRS
ncbi:hypothetical protein Sjap_007232 [Stephania japonica]|uniref:Uncharacterized protein n=1 Tax=Stephania japonica TaxID=461633 RepID=A0AAP0JNX1_9MAGN